MAESIAEVAVEVAWHPSAAKGENGKLKIENGKARGSMLQGLTGIGDRGIYRDWGYKGGWRRCARRRE